MAIVRTADTCGGKARIDGRRMPVIDVLGAHEQGLSPEEIADEYSVPLGDVLDALAWAAEHPEEIAADRQQRADGHRRARRAPGALDLGGAVYLPPGTLPDPEDPS